jgi:hypothetical protein
MSHRYHGIPLASRGKWGEFFVQPDDLGGLGRAFAPRCGEEPPDDGLGRSDHALLRDGMPKPNATSEKLHHAEPILATIDGQVYELRDRC